MRDVVLTYYFILRAVLRAKPELRPCRTRCRHCGIFFVTHPRNRGRRDLRCPFGCREAHRKKSSTERSVAYYATWEGKVKKKLQNDKRRKHRPKPDSTEGRNAASESREVQFDAAMVEHIRMVTSLIEGRAVSREEIVAMLRRTLRQHRIAGEKRIDHIVRFLKEHPP